jgi:hypothetical protein
LITCTQVLAVGKVLTSRLSSNARLVVYDCNLQVSNASEGWWLSAAFNLAAIHTKGAYLLKVDADYALSHDIIMRHQLRKGTFFAGNWRVAMNLEEKHLNGIVYVSRRDYQTINGYDERVATYGFDDEDLYERLENSGLTRLDVDLATISHIHHDDARRLAQDGQYSNPHVYTVRNMLLKPQVSESICSSLSCLPQTRDLGLSFFEFPFMHIFTELYFSYRLQQFFWFCF